MTGGPESTPPKGSGKGQPERLAAWVKGYIHLNATVVAAIGLFLLSTAWGTRNSTDWWLGMRDPILGISDRAALLIGGLLHLGAAAYLFATRDLLNRTLATLWLGLIHLAYYLALRWLEPAALPNTQRFIGWRLQLQPTVVGSAWRFFQLWLIVTSGVFLTLILVNSKRLRNEVWLKQWQDRRAQKPDERASPKSRSTDDHTKIACLQCGQRIAVPRSRLGEIISCPCCGAEVALREPPVSMDKPEAKLNARKNN